MEKQRKCAGKSMVGQSTEAALGHHSPPLLPCFPILFCIGEDGGAAEVPLLAGVFLGKGLLPGAQEVSGAHAPTALMDEGGELFSGPCCWPSIASILCGAFPNFLHNWTHRLLSTCISHGGL